MRRQLFSNRIGQSLVALIMVAILTAALSLLRAGLTTSVVALLFLLPVLLAAQTWGLVPGLVAAVASFLSFNYFFLHPLNTLSVTDPRDLLALGVFTALAVLISLLVGQVRANLAAVRVREREATSLYELSRAISTQPDLPGILKTVTEHTRQVFDLADCTVTLAGEPGLATLLSSQSAELTATPPPEPLIAPLETTEGRLGELRLYPRSKQRPSHEEQRLLAAFATQAALAIERVRLSQAATRAQVLEQSDRLKSALLSSVSHDFRSPLAAIKAATTSLQQHDVDWSETDRGEFLMAISEETERLNRLVGNLLDMSKIEAGALQLHRDWYPIEEVIGTVGRRLRRRHGDTPLAVQLVENLPLVPFDFIQIDRVLTNLIENSLRYAPPQTPVHIAARRYGPNLEVQVHNHGPHIPPDDLERIFDKFYRVIGGDRVTGTGLGLSICKGIVEAHSGKIWAENIATGGVNFCFTLPLTLQGIGPPEVRESERL